MTSEKGFRVEDEAGEPPKAPRARRDIHRRGGRRVRRDDGTSEAKPRTGGLALGPRVFLVVGALFAVLFWLGTFNRGLPWLGNFDPGAGLIAPEFAWDLFRDGGSWGSFVWDQVHAYALYLTVITGLIVLLVLFPRGRRRGILTLTLVGCTLALIPPSRVAFLPVVGVLLLCLGAGAILGATSGRGGSGRPVLLVLVLLLGAHLAFPVPAPVGAGVPGQAAQYSAPGVNLWREITEDAPAGPGPDPRGSILEWHEKPPAAIVLGVALVFLVGLLVLLGVGGRWAGWVAGLGALAGVLLHVYLQYRLHIRMIPDGVPQAHEGLAARATVDSLRAAFVPFALLLTAAMSDLMEPRKG